MDGERLIQALLERDAPAGFNLRSEHDTDDYTSTPLVLWSLMLDGETRNGPGLYTGNLVMSVYGLSIQVAGDAALAIAKKVHGWDLPGAAVIEGVGWVESVEPFAFSRAALPDMVGKGAFQYVGSTDLAIRTTQSPTSP